MALTNKLSAIGDAIRAKTGKSEKLTLDSMVTEINSITTGGSGGGSGEELLLNFCKRSLPLNEMIQTMKPIQEKVQTISKYLLNGKTISNSPSARPEDYQPLFNFPVVKTIEERGMNEYMNTVDSWLVNKYEQCTLNLPSLETMNGSYCCSSTKVGYLNAPKLKKIGANAFSSSKLKEVSLPNVTELNDGEFSYAENLKKARFDSLAKINANSYFYGPFYSCKALETLILPSPTLVTLANQDGLCGKITPGPYDTIPPIHPAYKGELPQGYIYVPKALIEQYKVATNWVAFADKFRAIEDYPEICGGGA